MAYNHEYPYTDPHRHNDDWVLGRIRELMSRDMFGSEARPFNSIMQGRNIALPPDYKELSAVPISTYGSADFLELWDGLVKENPEYFRKIIWGLDDFGNELSYYEWQPRNIKRCGLNSSGLYFADNFERLTQSKPGFIVVSGIHGNEKQAVFTFYQLFKKWLAGEYDGNYILDNLTFVIAPCCNPYGLNHNTRNNGHDVNINRNFPIKWDAYDAPATGSNGKGYNAADQRETQFLMYLINEAYRDIKYRAAMPVIDLHDHHYTLHSDRRLLWFVSNDRYLKFATLNSISWLHDVITSMYPDTEVSGDEIFCRWVSQVSAPDFDNWSRTLGHRNLVIESPDNFVEGMPYDEQTFVCSWLIIANTMTNIIDATLEDCQKATYLDWMEVGLTADNATVSLIAENLPRGARFLHYISSDAHIRPELPGEGAGILEVIKTTSKSYDDNESAIAKFTCTSYSQAHTYALSISASGVNHGWKKCGVYDNIDFDSTMTVAQIVEAMPRSGFADIRIYSDYAADVPEKPGVLTIHKSTDNASNVMALLEYHTTTSSPKGFVGRCYNGVRSDWKEVY